MEEVLSQGSVPCFGKNEGHLAVRILVRLGLVVFWLHSSKTSTERPQIPLDITCTLESCEFTVLRF